MRRVISRPFDFHHVTHTQPRHFARLDRGSQNELITEFIAVRAAQRPKSTLQGIQADDLCNTDPAKHREATKDDSSLPADDLQASIGHQKMPGSVRRPFSPENPRRMRASTSIENFSRPAPWSPNSPTSPPPRTSSRNVLHCSRLPMETIEAGKEIDEERLSDDLHLTQSVQGPQLAITHAITTNDDSAMSLKTSPLPNSSSNVTARTGNRTPDEQQAATNMCSLMRSPLSDAQSFPTTKILSQHESSDTSNSARQPVTSRSETSLPALTSQWEDVVDYCYEQNAEADCNFDWSQKTVFIESDSEAADPSSPKDLIVKELSSPADDQPPTPSDLELSLDARGSHPSLVSSINDNRLRLQSKKYTRELEDCVSPFGRHQAASEFRGYQHWPQIPSELTSNMYAASNDRYVDHNTCLSKSGLEGAGSGLTSELPPQLPRCYSGGRSHSLASIH